MGTKTKISKKIDDSIISTVKDYPRLQIGYTHGKQIFFMISPTKGICLTNHHESYYGLQTLPNDLKDFDGILEIYNKH